MNASLPVSAVLFLLGPLTLEAQQAAPRTEPEVAIQRVELGGQYVYLGSTTCYYLAGCQRPPGVAFGPALAVNLTRYLALEASYSTTLQQQQPPTAYYEGTVAGGRGSALAAGPRFELRRPRYGIFVFGETGYQSWSQAPEPFVSISTPYGPYYQRAAPARETYFAAGGGIGGEYSPTPRTHLRASVAERYVLYRAANTLAGSGAPDSWREAEVFSAGVWVGVGPRVRGTGVLRDPVQTHRFFDRTNILLITGANLAGITDAVVTRHFLDNGEAEGDPLERPFVQNGVGGFIALGLIAETAAIGLMYGLHRMGHHFLERLLPVTIMLGEGRSDYQVVRDTW